MGEHRPHGERGSGQGQATFAGQFLDAVDDLGGGVVGIVQAQGSREGACLGRILREAGGQAGRNTTGGKGPVVLVDRQGGGGEHRHVIDRNHVHHRGVRVGAVGPGGSYPGRVGRRSRGTGRLVPSPVGQCDLAGVSGIVRGVVVDRESDLRRGRQQEGRRGIDAGERRPVVSTIKTVRPDTRHRGGGVGDAGGRDGHAELGARVTVHTDACPLEIGEQVGGQKRCRDVLQLGPDNGRS